MGVIEIQRVPSRTVQEGRLQYASRVIDTEDRARAVD
jgi:hypothetical protein